jgi:hypothetical protein
VELFPEDSPMGTCKRQVHSIDHLQKKPRSSFAVGKGVFAKRVVYKWVLKRYILALEEHTLYIQTIYLSIGFFLAPCKHPSHLRVFTADKRGPTRTFPFVETLGSEAQQQDGLG